MPLILSAILIWFFYAYQKRKQQSELAAKDALLREQTLLLEKQTAIEKERSRIASEMHDDLGSGLTTIKYLSDKALIQAKDEGEKAEIKKIAQHSNNLVSNMGEIIWAMNSRFDNVDNLMGYIRRYASEYLEQYEVELIFTTNETETNAIITGEKRRNVFLVVKEILHNAVKYSGAKAIKIHFEIEENIEINISEVGGKGFDVEEMKDKSNGIYNMEKRMEGIGNILFNRNNEGMVIKILLN